MSRNFGWMEQQSAYPVTLLWKEQNVFVVYISTLVPKHVYFAVFSRIGSRPHYGMAALRSKNMQINLGSKRFSCLNGSNYTSVDPKQFTVSKFRLKPVILISEYVCSRCGHNGRQPETMGDNGRQDHFRAQEADHTNQHQGGQI